MITVNSTDIWNFVLKPIMNEGRIKRNKGSTGHSWSEAKMTTMMPWPGTQALLYRVLTNSYFRLILLFIRQKLHTLYTGFIKTSEIWPTFYDVFFLSAL